MLSLGLRHKASLTGFTESEAKHPADNSLFVILNEVKYLGHEFYLHNADDFFFAGQILRLRLRMTKEMLKMTETRFQR